MLSQDDANFENKNSSLFVTEDELNKAIGEGRAVITTTELDGIIHKDWKIPNILYSPENIFGNKIAALDINFINPHKYEGVEYDEDNVETDSSEEKSKKTAAEQIAPTIASWYKGFRNIAIVGLLSVLVYLGIRILIGSTAPEKAKYKERLVDWLVALCLVFVIHIIMSGILMVTEKITNLFSEESSEIIVATAENPDTVTSAGDIKPIGKSAGFRTNLTGYVRFMAQSSEFGDAAIYTILYMALIIYTVMFTFIYFKRFLYMAFFTMIAPLVALTYPLDKVRDNTAQAFNLWFKEYTMNAILQPVHLILYTVLVSSAMELAIENPIYAIVATAFLLPAEKFIKKLFGLDRAESTSSLGAFAGGALTMKGVGAVAGLFKGNGKKANGDKEALDKSLTEGKVINAVNSNPLNTIAEGAEGLIDNTINSTNANNTTNSTNANNTTNSTNANNTTNSTNANNTTNSTNANNTTNSTTEKRGGFKNAFSAVSNQIGLSASRKLKNTFSAQSMKKGVKYLGKSGVKLAGAALGATALGTIGTAAAMTTGDLEKGISMAAGSMALGAGLGGNMGGKLANAIGNSSDSSLINTWKNAYNPNRIEEIKNKEIEKNQEEFKSSVSNYQTLINKGFSANEAKEFLEKEVQDYLNVGIDNINLMIKAEKKYKDKYDKAGRVARAQLANNLPKNYSKDLEAQKKFMESVKSNEPRLTTDNVRELNKDMKDLLD